MNIEFLQTATAAATALGEEFVAKRIDESDGVACLVTAEPLLCGDEYVVRFYDTDAELLIIVRRGFKDAAAALAYAEKLIP